MVLTAEQEAFVRYQQGAAVLHAPVGTGKTLCLAERAAVAIRRGLPASRILCVTFTNLAAEQMRSRVQAQCGQAGADIVVRTFHSLCAWILRSEAKTVGIPADFVIFDENDGEELLRALLRQRPQFAHLGAGFLYQQISWAKVTAPAGALRLPPDVRALFAHFDPASRELAEDYQATLAAHHALDFADLIWMTLAAFASKPDVRARWEHRFELVQVDEMQDTHLAEYGVICTLARHAASLVLAGDFDQTIYEWRGSTPDKVLARFRQDFPGAVDFHFTENHRATRRLLEATNAFAASFSRRPRPRPAAHLPPGAPIVYHFAPDGDAEADWIAARLRQLHAEQARTDEPLRWRDVGILVRPNHRAQTVGRALERAGVPHLTVETYEFVRRQEVKDALAYLRLLVNPADGHALARVLQRPPRGIGEATLARAAAAEAHGLRVTDLVDLASLQAGDPFDPLMDALRQGRVVVLDTETTGLDPARDEVVELAALRLDRGQVSQRLHRYLRPTRPVGESVSKHGLTDEFLARHGEPAGRVLSELAAMLAGAVVVGHNVGFDRRMLVAHARRLGLRLELPLVVDTYELARRFVGGPDLTLQGLCERLGTTARPAHRASEDVAATLELLARLLPDVERAAPARREAVEGLRRAFLPLAEEVAELRREVGVLRPPALLDRVPERSGLLRYYSDEPWRLANLDELRRVFGQRDDPAADPLSSLEGILTFAALARNVDRVGREDDRVRVLTVHQAKGLEFDVVVVAGLSENEFPNYGSIKEGREPEERRLLYVALTRARRHLILTGHARHEGKPRDPSRYLRLLAGHLVEEGSGTLAG